MWTTCEWIWWRAHNSMVDGHKLSTLYEVFNEDESTTSYDEAESSITSIQTIFPSIYLNGDFIDEGPSALPTPSSATAALSSSGQVGLFTKHNGTADGGTTFVAASLAEDEITATLGHPPPSSTHPHSILQQQQRHPNSIGMYSREYSNSLDNASIHNIFVLPDCPLYSVTVFLDRAEVCRTVRPRVSANQFTQVLFRKLSPHVDKDSIRVEVKGAATIQDVSFSCRQFRDEEAEHFHTHNDLRNKLKIERRHFEALMVKRARLEKQRNVLDAFADTLMGPVPAAMSNMEKSFISCNLPEEMELKRLDGLASDRYNPQHMEAMKGFFELYEDRADRLDDSLMSVREELEATECTIRQLEQSIRQIELRNDEHTARELTVVVEATESGQLELFVTYVVLNARWLPSYDVRIFNTDASLKIIYYGMIQQATGEDWETSRMKLSTALPSVGGTAPELVTQTMLFRSTNKNNTPLGLIKKSKSGSKGFRSSKTRAAKATGTTPANATTAATTPYSNVSTEATTPSGINERDPTSGLEDQMGPVSPGFYPSPSMRSSLFINAGSGGCGSAGAGGALTSSLILESPAGNNTLTRMPFTFNNRHSLYGGGGGGTGGSSAWDDWGAGDDTLTYNGHNPAAKFMREAASTVLPRDGFHNDNVNGMGKRPHESSTPNAGTQYDVARPPACIPCDGHRHRVTVAIIDLQPSLEYVSAPKKSPCAYVQAKMQNNSKFLLLPGPTNIYVDNNFVGKSSLGCVAPAEEFSCKLGADQGIKVLYNPMYKYKEMTTSAGKNIIYTFKQVMEIKNMHPRSIKLLVLDQLPVSGEDKIKINLLEPIIKNMDKYDKSRAIRINKSSIIEWDLDLQPGEQRELTLKYSIEHPVNEDVAFVEL